MKDLLIIVAIAAVLFSSMAVAQASREVHKTVPLDSDGRVTIDTYKGSIEVEVWDKAEVDITARITAEDGDEESVEATKIDIAGSGVSVRIMTDYERVHRGTSWVFGFVRSESTNLPYVDYSIRMPATASLRVKDYKSDTRIGGLQSRITMNTYKGTFDIRGLEGSIELETYKGEGDVEIKELKGNCSFETYKGTIGLTLPAKSGFDLAADIGQKGSLDSQFGLPDRDWDCRKKEERYRTEVNGGGFELRLKTYKGEYRLKRR